MRKIEREKILLLTMMNFHIEIKIESHHIREFEERDVRCRRDVSTNSFDVIMQK
jgi:hypothetical protein